MDTEQIEGTTEETTPAPERTFRLPAHVNYLRTVSDTALRKAFKAVEQDFTALKKEHLEAGTLFMDPEFPCTEQSLQLLEPVPGGEVEWRRPKDIPGVQQPQFVVETFSRFDIQQGNLGDCWFLSTLASLALHPELVRYIIPSDQSFDDGDYAGIFHFKFWKNGKWVDIVVDDRLPILSASKSVAFEHSVTANEFWAALIEKAYAKFYGSYGALDGGLPGEAMEDLTGGVVQRFSLDTRLPYEVFTVLHNAFQTNSIVACGILYNSKEINALGLYGGHAYSVTGVLERSGTQLVRVRNPWGNKIEWNGPWSDKSPEWNGDEPPSKADGEFWMSIKDFVKYFNLVEVCYYQLPGLSDWREKVLEGSWVRDINDGGSRNFDTYHLNPQYRFLLDEDTDSENGSVLISLLQINRRREQLQCLRVGFDLFEVDSSTEGRDKITSLNLHVMVPLECDPQYSGRRTETATFNLKAGSYVVVPSTHRPGQESDFLLRVIYKQPFNLRVLKPIQTGILDTQKEFYKVSKDSHEVDADQLKQVLKRSLRSEHTFGWNLPAYLCYQRPKGLKLSQPFVDDLLAKYDRDGSKKLTYEEFRVLWEDVSAWKTVFSTHDVNKTGSLTIGKVVDILEGYGLRISEVDSRIVQDADRDLQLSFEESLSFALYSS